MFRLHLHPTPAGLALGFLLIAFWALLWFWFLAQVMRGPQDGARRGGPSPELTQLRAREARRAKYLDRGAVIGTENGEAYGEQGARGASSGSVVDLR